MVSLVQARTASKQRYSVYQINKSEKLMQHRILCHQAFESRHLYNNFSNFQTVGSFQNKDTIMATPCGPQRTHKLQPGLTFQWAFRIVTQYHLLWGTVHPYIDLSRYNVDVIQSHVVFMYCQIIRYLRVYIHEIQILFLQIHS